MLLVERSKFGLNELLERAPLECGRHDGNFAIGANCQAVLQRLAKLCNDLGLLTSALSAHAAQSDAIWIGSGAEDVTAGSQVERNLLGVVDG